MLNNRTAYGLLALIVCLFMALGTLYAVLTPPWQAPDEPAHYNYIAQINRSGCCPVIESGDWDSSYLENLKANQFPEGADLASIEYEDHQPPLYYLVASVIYNLFDGSLIALRLLSVVLGAGVMLAAYFTAARLVPWRPLFALSVTAFVAFLPQHIAMLSSVNNDSMAELILGMLIVVALGYLGNPTAPDHNGIEQPLPEASRPLASALGGLTGLAFLTKLTIYLPAVLVVAVAILLRWRQERQSWRWLSIQVAWGAGLALVLGAIWWGRNIVIYGWPDIMAQAAHNSVVVGQLRTAEAMAARGTAAYLRDFVTTTYHSFFGQFGWMAVPMPPRVYQLIGLFLALATAGWAVTLLAFRERLHVSEPRRAARWVLLAVLLATLFNYLYYNLTFVQFQGRYLFTALIPLGVLVVAGLWGWVLLLHRWLDSKAIQHWLAWLPLAGTLWLGLLSVYALFRFVIPNLD